MSTSAGTSVGATRKEISGLPRVNYKAPVAITLVAAVVLFFTLLALAFFGVLNTITLFQRSGSESGASPVGGTVCGILTLMAIAGVFYFFLAIIKGVRDLSGSMYYTRGTVLVRPGVQSRNAKNWLLVDPSYIGEDIGAASTVTDEQHAASVDRSQIFNPRQTPGLGRRKPDVVDEDLMRKLDQTGRTERKTASDSYLNPARIAANQPIQELESPQPPPNRVVFRIDFANKAGIVADEEVLVAHSRYLQHVYYVARLRNGEWVPFRNRSLI